MVLLQGWLSLESAGAKRLHELLKSAVPIDGVLEIMCGYYTLTPEEMKRSIVLNAADETFVALTRLDATCVKHTMQSFPGEYLGRDSHYLNLESLQSGRAVDYDVINYFLMLLEEQTRNAAVCLAADIPRIGVLPSVFASSDEVIDYQGFEQSCRRHDWLGWCAARNGVLDSFCLDLIMFPVDFLSIYALGVINCRKRCIQVYHTVGPKYDPHILSVIRTRCELVAIYVHKDARGYSPCTEYDEVWEVKILHPGEQAVLAGNVWCVESGVSLCMHVYHLAFGMVPDFVREAFPGFRRRMVRDLLVRNQLL
jgi:hypothetical protein